MPPQRGSGEPLKFFRGTKYVQSGDGFPIFSDLFKKALPLITQHVLPFLGKQLIQGGSDTFEQLQQGAPLKVALKSAAKRTLQRTRDDLFGAPQRKPYKRSKSPQDYFTRL
jgi:hypothetical protein